MWRWLSETIWWWGCADFQVEQYKAGTVKVPGYQWVARAVGIGLLALIGFLGATVIIALVRL